MSSFSLDAGRRFQRRSATIAIPSAAAAAAASAAAVSTTAAAATLAGAVRRARFGRGDVQGAPTLLRAVERRDGRLAFSVVRHGDETETTATAGVAIHHNLGAFDGAMGGEEGGEFLVGHRPGEIAYV